ncbi:enkurin-like [Parambassis ranga]|uniref:Enkurin-like n=1 Tax=Parambassis ranga TaxID=210632 RepID=A0A6P7KHE9_9TELE|nr:enkurin-like isoform X1 [Parambassis ranga]XP_028288886.1 enkurin-like [Parambassis ranga]XP_028288940.1 enkurin-like [Parambassis ranga]XP_028289000.1 enkurin-like [Parambassis ranga]
MPEGVKPPESIYNCIPEKERKIEKPPLYMSKHRPAVLLESKSNKDARRTMGPAKIMVSPPDNYLKKHSTEARVSKNTPPSKHVRTVRKPPVPLRTEVPLMGIPTKKACLNTTVMVPKKPHPTIVDSNKGSKQLLENSGLVPKYSRKKDYGQVPEYLLQRNEEERIAQERHEDFLKEQREQASMKNLSEEERQAVLETLKKNWDKVHHEYQCLPLIIETLSRKTHKLRLEEAMTQLERDINLFERFKTIYIPSN